MAEPGTGYGVSSVGLHREGSPEILPMKGGFAPSTLVLGARLEKVPAEAGPWPLGLGRMKEEGMEGMLFACTEVKHRKGAEP